MEPARRLVRVAAAAVFSPLYWFYGEIALPHTLDALMVIVAATLSWRVWRGEARLATMLALWLGLAGGCASRRWCFCCRWPWSPAGDCLCATLFLCLAILTVTTLAWLLPLLHLSGGWTRYWSVVKAYSEMFDRPTSVFLGAGWHGLHHNLSKLFRYTLWAWAFGLYSAGAGGFGDTPADAGDAWVATRACGCWPCGPRRRCFFTSSSTWASRG